MVNIPRWLKIQEQVDYYIWQLGQLLETDKNLSSIERMIDESTGYDKKKIAIAKRMMNKVKKLIKEYKEITNEK